MCGLMSVAPTGRLPEAETVGIPEPLESAGRGMMRIPTMAETLIMGQARRVRGPQGGRALRTRVQQEEVGG